MCFFLLNFTFSYNNITWFQNANYIFLRWLTWLIPPMSFNFISSIYPRTWIFCDYLLILVKLFQGRNWLSILTCLRLKWFEIMKKKIIFNFLNNTFEMIFILIIWTSIYVAFYYLNVRNIIFFKRGFDIIKR